MKKQIKLNLPLSDATEAVIRVNYKLHDGRPGEGVLVRRADLATIVEALTESWEKLAEWEEFRERLDVIGVSSSERD